MRRNVGEIVVGNLDGRANFVGPELDRLRIFILAGGHGAGRQVALRYGAEDRGLTFIPVIEAGNVIVESIDRRAGLVEGQFTAPAFAPETHDPKAMHSLYGEVPALSTLSRGVKTTLASRGFLRAWNVAEHRVVWEAPTATSRDGGVLATAGGVVFQGDANGFPNAYAADSGQKLAAVQLGSSMTAAPMTYRVNGVQYVAIMAGYGGGAVIVGSPFDPASAAYKYGNDGRIIVLKRDGPVPPLPPLQKEDGPPPDPPAHSGTPAQSVWCLHRFANDWLAMPVGVPTDLPHACASMQGQ